MIAITTNKKPPPLKSKTNPAFVDLACYDVGNDPIRAVTFVENSERERLKYIWGNDSNWFEKNTGTLVNLNANQKIYVKILRKYLDKVSVISQVGLETFILDLANVSHEIKNLEYLLVGIAGVIENLGQLSINPSFTKLKRLEFFRCNISPLNNISAIESLIELEALILTDSNFTGIFNISKLTKLNNIDFEECNLTTEDLDYYVQTLYEAGNSFIGTGKTLDIRRQALDAKASGTIEDLATAGTGQGFINGLIDQFGWTVFQ